ncbi:ribose-phosphate diphosphokinase, partial [Candidatus Uhrbacteria bacterium]|nr:ribose-phosphate diphosphokinase [Candidatus Uhrbacteria bacterium]
DMEPFAEILESVHAKPCAVIACDASDGRASVNDYAMLTRHLLGALDYAEADIHALIFPYYPYARQDRHKGESTDRTAAAAKMHAEDLERAAEIRFIGVMEPHTVYIETWFKRRCRRLPVVQEFVAPLREYFGGFQNVVFASPDVGGLQRTRRTAHLAGSTLPCAVIDKDRERIGEVARATKVAGDLTGHDVVVVDDILDTAGTLCNSVRIAKAEGARRVVAAVVHGLFNNDALERLIACEVDKVFITSSVTQKPAVRESVLVRIIPIGDLTAEVIRCAITKGSWSALRRSRLDRVT